MLKRLSLTNLVAWVHLISRRKQTAVAALGVTFSIAMTVFLLNFIQGLNRTLSELMTSQLPSLHIYNDITAPRTHLASLAQPHSLHFIHNPRPLDEPARLRQPQEMLALLRQHPQVVAAAPLVSTQLFFSYGPVQLSGQVRGVDPAAENALNDQEQYMRQGRFQDLGSVPDGVILGVGLARKMGLEVGDRVDAVAPTGTVASLKVVGLIFFGTAMVDDVRAYVTLSTAQRLMNQNAQYVTDINVRLRNNDLAPALAAQFQRQFGYRVQSYQEANAGIETGDKVRRFIFTGVVVALLIVSGFGIYNVMSMLIREKMQDIAILKAIGLSGPDVRNIFVRQALAIGSVGGVVGLGLGWVISSAVAKVPFRNDQFPKLQTLPVDFDPTYYALGLAFGIAVAVVAAWFPARKAARVDPIAIIRGR
jgi:lipoprotein-releasing system permease protein